MEFGLFDWIDRDPLLLADTYEQRLQVLAAADELGYWCYHLAEHHGTPLGMAPAPGLFLAAAAQRTRRIRLGPLVYLLPLYDPVRLAEEIAMLDHLSRGRLELGIGRGASPYELAMLNVDVAETKAMFDEALAVILMGLTTGRVDYAGQHYHYRDVLLPTRPYQQPYPPLWYPTSNPASMPWVGQQRFSTLWTHTSRDLAEQRAMIAAYEQALAGPPAGAAPNAPALAGPPAPGVLSEQALAGPPAGGAALNEQALANPPPGGAAPLAARGALNAHVSRPRYGLVRHVCVAPTDAEALAAARAAWPAWHSSFNFLWRLHDNPRHEASAAFDGAVESGMAVVGSPATVVARLRAIFAATGGNYFAACVSWGSLTLDQQLTSLRLFAEQAMPAF
ncbi:MAG TPA: LLM class flavin-dependent oxidoreductase [Chloroflexota bacterium]|jgi:alkanesulfonate monooxygenase SsuD/methylene tetrahydromethanopterin reductase-like flavin-dependent oxidoreductase (luciferase family)